ncbi:DUF2461 family protein [Hymenobacter humi]|uniref:DUF2461 family protein n=1 Tax=Hymenobacter humi TaxID=1411620 RepID=A0ABW2UCT7_9BACT
MELHYLLNFLARLAANNTTAWMADHRPDYQRARAACTEPGGPCVGPGCCHRPRPGRPQHGGRDVPAAQERPRPP